MKQTSRCLLMLGLMQFFMIAGAVSACYSAVLPQNQAPEVNAVTTKSEDDKKKEEQKMSEYTEELELIDYAKKLIEKSKKQLPTVASEQFLPEVLTDEEIEKKLHDFSRVFYLSKSHFKAFKSAQVKFINFETVTREEKNMGVGIRWEKVMTESGRNLIDPSRIEDPDDVRVIYVKHNNGITDFMSLPDYDIPIIDDIGDDEILDYAQGEATVIFRPGYDRLVIKKSDITRTLSLEKITCLVETIGQHHIKLIFDEKGYERPMAVAYNKDGVRLEGLEWVSYPLYANGKSVESFTPETYPDEDELEKFAFLALFSGEIDRIELFFEKDRQTRKIPIKTTQLLPDKMAWDDYKDISEWVDLPFRPHANFKTLSREKMQDSLFVQFERSEAMMGFNDPELKLHLPAIANSTFAEVWFNNLECRETPEDEFRPIRFQNRGETEIYGFKYKKTEDDEHRKKMNLIPFKSRIAGNLVVWYPQDLQWHEAGRGTSYIADDHKVVVEGGLVSYFPPEGYDLPKISEEPGYYIRAISPEGKLLDLNSSVFLLSNNNPSKGIRFGFWGQIEKLEIAVVHQWTKFESRFEAMVLPEFTENSQVNDMMAFLTEAGLLKFEVGGEKIDISTLTDKTEEDKKEKLKFTGYNVTAFVQVGKKKIKPYTWNGELPGDTAFCKSHLELLLEEVLQLVNRSKKDVYYRYRLAAPKVAFAQVNDNNRIVKQITLPDLDKQKETSDRLEKLKATLSRALEDWLVVDPAEKAELSGFSKQKIPQSHFIRELVFRNQDLDQDINYKQIKDIYTHYQKAFDNETSDEIIEKVGSVVAYVLGARTSMDLVFKEGDTYQLRIGDMMQNLTPFQEWTEIDRRILDLLFRDGIRDDINGITFRDLVDFRIGDDPDKDVFHILAWELMQLVDDETFYKFVYSLPILRDMDKDTSVHRFLLTQDFERVYTHTPDRKKEDCYLLFAQKDVKILKYNFDLLYDDILHKFSSYAKSRTIGILYSINHYLQERYDKELKEIMRAIKYPYSAISAAKLLLDYDREMFTDLTYKVIYDAITANKSTKFELDDDDIEFFNDGYKEKAQGLIDAARKNKAQLAD